MIDLDLIMLYNKACEKGSIKVRIALRDEINEQLFTDAIDEIYNIITVDWTKNEIENSTLKGLKNEKIITNN